MENIINISEQVDGGIPSKAISSESISISGKYDVSCYGADGELKWEDTIHNLVMTVGKTDILTNYFTGSGYTAAFFLGLLNTGATYAIGDTMSSHSGWTENINYASATRPAPSWNAASGTARSTTATAYAINGAGGTIAGAFLTTVSTKSGTTGVLYSAGNFTGGDKVVANGDTLNVTYTANIT